MIHKWLCVLQTALSLRVRRMTAFMAIAVIATVMAASPSNAAVSESPPPLIQLEPGLDARCVAQVNVDSARLLCAAPQWWARQYKWEGVRFTCQRRAADGSIPFTWNVPGLGIAGGGLIVNGGAGAVQWNWRLTAEKEWPVI